MVDENKVQLILEKVTIIENTIVDMRICLSGELKNSKDLGLVGQVQKNTQGQKWLYGLYSTTILALISILCILFAQSCM